MRFAYYTGILFVIYAHYPMNTIAKNTIKTFKNYPKTHILL